MPLEDQGIDLPQRAEQALNKKVIVKEWGIKPWNMDRLMVSDLQDIGLAEHAEAYIKQQQMNDARRGGMKSKRNTKAQRDFRERNRERYGGMTQ